jgi:flavorubredoxin
MGEMFRFKNIVVRIWSDDHGHPHVEAFMPSMKGYEAKAKFWLDTLDCFESHGFSDKALRQIKEECKKRHEKLKEKWKEIHGED